MFEIFAHDFMIRALIAGLLAGTALALLSVIVVHKNLSFMGVGISHSAFGGVAFGFMAGINLTISALVFSSLVALLIGWLSRRGQFHEDVTIGVVFAMSMALGVVFLGLADETGIDLFAYLFGSILAVQPSDLILLSVVLVLVLAVIVLFFKEFMVFCFDEEWASLSGINTPLLGNLLLLLIAVTVVASIKLLGVVLVSALLVTPGATATQITDRFFRQFFVSIAVALLSVIAGLLLSYQFDVSSGSAIILLSCMFFFVATFMNTKLRT